MDALHSSQTSHRPKVKQSRKREGNFSFRIEVKRWDKLLWLLLKNRRGEFVVSKVIGRLAGFSGVLEGGVDVYPTPPSHCV